MDGISGIQRNDQSVDSHAINWNWLAIEFRVARHPRVDTTV